MTQLPAELWECIFDRLTPVLQNVLTVRLVCRHWKTIVDRKRSLWDRIRVKVPNDVTQMDGSVVSSLAPASEICLNGVRIVCLDFWPSIAERLTGLRMRGCTVSRGIFLEMLGGVPNLERLEVGWLRLNGSKERPEFRLEKLKSLQLLNYSDEILDIFTRRCPNLQELSLVDDEDHDEATARLIDSVQGTLERLQVFMTPYLLQKISLMERLRLKSAKLDNHAQDNLIVDLSRFQPFLEEFKIIFQQSSGLCEIGRNLPRLKRLNVHLFYDSDSDDPPPSLAFLATMPLLEKLEIGNGLEPLDFNDLQCPKLTEFVLENVEVTNSLRSFLINSRNLQTLKFQTCAFQNWSDLLSTLADLPSLQHLDLWYIQVDNTNIPPRNPQPVTNLQSLQIYPVTPITNEMLLDLVSTSPNLKVLKLIAFEAVDDATVTALCRLLPQLVHLQLDGCSITGTTCAAAAILEHCPRLERLEVNNCQAPLEDAVRKLANDEVNRGSGRRVEINGGK